jgi:hypothetical protein
MHRPEAEITPGEFNAAVEPLPCPFCGGEVQTIKDQYPRLYRPSRNGWHIQCNTCDMLFGYDVDYSGVYATEQAAIEAVNTRTPEIVYCCDCELRGNCVMEDSFRIARLDKNRRFCGIGKRRAITESVSKQIEK